MKEDKLALSKFRKAAKQLQAALEYARTVWPKAELYLASGDLCLMKGEHHSDNGRARNDNILDSIHMIGFDGGDW